MSLRVLAFAAVAVFLGGCTNADWDHALNYVGIGESQKPAPKDQADSSQPAPAQTADATANAAPAAANAAAGVNQWCEEVANATKADAAQDGFDDATQHRRAQAAYNQCNHTPAATN